MPRLENNTVGVPGTILGNSLDNLYSKPLNFEKTGEDSMGYPIFTTQRYGNAYTVTVETVRCTVAQLPEGQRKPTAKIVGGRVVDEELEKEDEEKKQKQRQSQQKQQQEALKEEEKRLKEEEKKINEQMKTANKEEKPNLENRLKDLKKQEEDLKKREEEMRKQEEETKKQEQQQQKEQPKDVPPKVEEKLEIEGRKKENRDEQGTMKDREKDLSKKL